MATYQPGDTVRLATTFLVGQTPTDPSAVTVAVTAPSGTTTSYTYGMDAEVIKDSTGAYHADIAAADAGIWSWKWTGTGAAAGVDEGTFTVERALAGSGVLCSVDDVRAYLQKPSTDTSQDDIVSVLITRASRLITNYCRREFVLAGTTGSPVTRYFDLAGHVAGREVSVGDLSTTPATAVLIDSYGDVVTTLTVATDLVLLPQNRLAHEPIRYVRFRPNVSLDPTHQLRLTGVFGFPQIPDDVRQACILTVGIWMRRDVQAFSATFNLAEDRLERPEALPSGVRGMLMHYRPMLIH